MATKCPKCGFYQDQGTECGRCGIIFSRYRPIEAEFAPSQYTDPEEDVSGSPSISPLRRIFRIFRWSSLGILGITIILILLPSPPPEIEASTKSAERAETKVRKFAASLEKGQALPLEINQQELNSWLKTNVALQHSTPVAEQSFQGEDPQGSMNLNIDDSPQDSELSIEEAQSWVKEIRIELLEDSLRGFVAFDFHGKELTLVLEGFLSVQEGYLHFEPKSGQLGSLPLPAVALESAAQKLFEDPKNREIFRLPPQILGIHVLNKNLILIPQ